MKETVDPSLFNCKKLNIDLHSARMWEDYLYIHKYGNSPLILCPVYFRDIAECESTVDAKLSRKNKDKEQQLQLMRQAGIIK